MSLIYLLLYLFFRNFSKKFINFVLVFFVNVKFYSTFNIFK